MPKKPVWTQTDDGKVRLFTADPRIKADGVGRHLFFVIGVMMSRGVPATRIVELAALATKMYTTHTKGK